MDVADVSAEDEARLLASPVARMAAADNDDDDKECTANEAGQNGQAMAMDGEPQPQPNEHRPSPAEEEHRSGEGGQAPTHTPPAPPPPQPQEPNEAMPEGPQPCIMFLDSARLHHPQSVFKALRAYMQLLWDFRDLKTSKDDTTPLSTTSVGDSDSVSKGVKQELEGTENSTELNALTAANGPGGSASSLASPAPAHTAAPMPMDTDAAASVATPAQSAVSPEAKDSGVVVDSQSLVCFSPKVPQQMNDCDCGVFVLHFIEKLSKELTGHAIDFNFIQVWCLTTDPQRRSHASWLPLVYFSGYRCPFCNPGMRVMRLATLT